MKSVSFLKNLEKASPVNQHRLGALLTGFYDCSGLPGARGPLPTSWAALRGLSGCPPPTRRPAPTPSGSHESIPSWGAEPENFEIFENS